MYVGEALSLQLTGYTSRSVYEVELGLVGLFQNIVAEWLVTE